MSMTRSVKTPMNVALPVSRLIGRAGHVRGRDAAIVQRAIDDRRAAGVDVVPQVLSGVRAINIEDLCFDTSLH
jgi:hypothetical protein